MISHQIIKTALTGSSNGGENPALSVFHWFAAVTQELLEDFAASSPSPRAHSVFETTFEFSFQESITVVVGVDLQSQISVSVNPTIYLTFYVDLPKNVDSPSTLLVRN